MGKKITYLDRPVQDETSVFDDITDYLAETAESAIDSIDAGFALGVANAIGQGVTFGFADEAIAGIASLGGYDYEEVRDAIRENLDQFRDENTAIAYGAEIASSLLAPAGLVRAAGALGVKGIAKAAAKKAVDQPVAAAAVGGATYGAGAAEELEDVPMSMATGGALGAAGQFIAPVAGRAARALERAGVKVTPGQMFGGTLKGLEEKLTSVPLVGTAIAQAQRKAVESFSPVALNRALKPIGGVIPKAMKPRPAFNRAKRILRDRYDKLLGGVNISMSDDVLASIQSSFDEARVIGGQTYRTQVNDAISKAESLLLDALDGNMLSGSALYKVQSELSDLSAKAVKRNEFEVADAISKIDESLMDIFVANAPGKLDELTSLKKAYSNFIPLRRAASAADDSQISPGRMLQAIRAEERKLGATGLGRLAAGEGRMQRFAETAKDIIGREVPDSGTAGRFLAPLAITSGIGATGGLLFGQAETGTLGGLGLGLAGAGLSRGMYTPLGQKALKDVIIPAYSGTLRSPATAGLLAQPTGEMASNLLGVGEARAEPRDPPVYTYEQGVDRLGRPYTMAIDQYGTATRVR